MPLLMITCVRISFNQKKKASGHGMNTYMHIKKITWAALLISYTRKIGNISQFTIHYEFVLIDTRREDQENGMVLARSLQSLPEITNM